jgi:hypothetical protein
MRNKVGLLMLVALAKSIFLCFLLVIRGRHKAIPEFKFRKK